MSPDQPSECWMCAMRNSSIWPLKDRRCRSRAGRCQGQLGEHSFYLLIDKRFNRNSAKCAPRLVGLSIPISLSCLSEPRLWRRVVARFNSPVATGTSSLARRTIGVALRFKADRAIRLAAVGPSSFRIFSISRAPVTLISRHSALPPAPDTDRAGTGQGRRRRQFCGRARRAPPRRSRDLNLLDAELVDHDVLVGLARTQDRGVAPLLLVDRVGV